MLVHLEGKAYNQSYIKCPDCKQVMVLKLSKDKENIYYSCDNFPACSNFHPAWPNGEAQGEVVSRKLRDARKACWESFQDVAGMGNKKAYEWLKRTWGCSKISTFNSQQCKELNHELFRIGNAKRALHEKSREPLGKF